MSEVIVTFKVMPSDSDVDMDALEARIKESLSPDRMTREPVAFGLFSLSVIKIIEDAEGEMEKAETSLRSLEGVGEVEVASLTKTI